MSIEVEVGLENFDKVPAIEPENKPNRLARGWANPKVRWAAAAGALALVAVLGLLYLHYHGRETTDDAQVDGHLAPVSAKVSGNVVEVLVTDNQPVKAGQVLVRIDPRDYQVKVNQERAALAMSEGQAQGATISVPMSRATTSSGKSGAEAQLASAEADLARAGLSDEQARSADLAYAQAEIEKRRANFELAKSDGPREAIGGKRGNFKAAIGLLRGQNSRNGKRIEGRRAEIGSGTKKRGNRWSPNACRTRASSAGEIDSTRGARQGRASADPRCRSYNSNGSRGTGESECGDGGVKFKLHHDRCAGGRGCNAQTGRGWTDRAAGTSSIDGRAAARSLGHSKF